MLLASPPQFFLPTLRLYGIVLKSFKIQKEKEVPVVLGIATIDFR